MIPLKLLLSKIVMVSVLSNLTRNITNLKPIGNPLVNLENFLIRNLQDLIGNPISLKEKSLKPNPKLLLITKTPYVTNMV